MDVPNKIVTTVFLTGCSYKCVYCHNAHLQNSNYPSDISWFQVFNKIKSRVNVIDGVCFSGGEALLQKPVFEAMRQVKDLGLNVYLHTAGVSVKRFMEAVDSNLISWIGLDIKSLPEDYSEITNTTFKDINNLAPYKCLEYLVKANIDYQIRITQYLPILTDQKVESLKKLLVDKYKVDLRKIVIQECILRGEY